MFYILMHVQVILESPDCTEILQWHEHKSIERGLFHSDVIYVVSRSFRLVLKNSLLTRRYFFETQSYCKTSRFTPFASLLESSLESS